MYIYLYQFGSRFCEYIGDILSLVVVGRSIIFTPCLQCSFIEIISNNYYRFTLKICSFYNLNKCKLKNIQHRYLHWLSLVDRIQYYVMNIGVIIELLKLFKILVKFKLFFSQFTAGCRQIHALSEMFNHESSITSSIPR